MSADTRTYIVTIVNDGMESTHRIIVCTERKKDRIQKILTRIIARNDRIHQATIAEMPEVSTLDTTLQYLNKLADC